MINIKKIGLVSILGASLLLSSAFNVIGEETEIEDVSKLSIKQLVDRGLTTKVYITPEDGLNIRKSPSLENDNNILTALPIGTELEKVKDSVKKEWSIIWYEGKARFVYSEFISEQAPEIKYEYEYDSNNTYGSDIVNYNEPVVIEQPVEYDEEEQEEVVENDYTASSATYSPNEFMYNGVIYDSGYRWTWYSENVLPGGGLNIPGRYTDEQGYVRDGDGYICLASSDLSQGTVVDTPFGGEGKVYDTGCASGTLDVYVGW